MHQCRYHVFGDRIGVASRQIGHRYAARGGGGNRDEVETDAVADDAPQARRMIDDVVGQLGAHDDAVGILRPCAQGFRPGVGRDDQFDMRREDRFAVGMHRIGQEDDWFVRHLTRVPR